MLVSLKARAPRLNRRVTMHHKTPKTSVATRVRIAGIMTVVMTLSVGLLKITAPLQHQLA